MTKQSNLYSQGTFSPEAQLLLTCARTTLNTKEIHQLKDLLSTKLDWPLLIKYSVSHGLNPLLYQNLNTICPEAVPKAVLVYLKTFYRWNAGRAKLMSEELVKLITLLKALGISALPYKGPVLAASVYRNLSFRQVGDLDIVVSRKDLPHARKVFASQPYQLQLTPEEEAIFLKNRYHLHYAREDGKVDVELHWAFTRRYWPFPLTIEQLWKRIEVIEIHGSPMPNLPPEDLLILLCMHGAKDHWVRLMWVCDIAELTRRNPNLDWNRTIQQAKALGARRILFLGLYLAHQLLSAPIPLDIIQTMIADRHVVDLVAQVEKQMFSNSESDDRAIEGHSYYLRLRERWQDRIPYLLHYLPKMFKPNAADRAMLPVPPFLSFLHYVLRPIRIASKYSLRLISHHLR